MAAKRSTYNADDINGTISADTGTSRMSRSPFLKALFRCGRYGERGATSQPMLIQLELTKSSLWEHTEESVRYPCSTSAWRVAGDILTRGPRNAVIDVPAWSSNKCVACSI